jgi:membrane protease YdiL (CAAX protease family)
MPLHPVVLAIVSLMPAFILIAYGWLRQRKLGKHKVYLDMLLMLVPATFLYYPLMWSLPESPLNSYAYFFIKLVLFTLPALLIIRYRGYNLEDFGITKERFRLSMLLGLGFLIVTALVSALIFSNAIDLDLFMIATWSVPMFLDAFNEEFIFRGVFFLFAYKNTRHLPLSYAVSMLLAFAWHPFELARMVPVFVQGTLLSYVMYKSGNISGAWVSHGINRSLINVFIRLLK